MLIPAAWLPQQNRACESCAFVVAVMPLQTWTCSPPCPNPREIPGNGTCVPAHPLGWRKWNQEVLEVPEWELRSRASIFTFYVILLDLQENLFGSSLCITFVHLWRRCPKVLKLHSVQNTPGTLAGKRYGDVGLYLLLVPTWAILRCSSDVWCLPDNRTYR